MKVTDSLILAAVGGLLVGATTGCSNEKPADSPSGNTAKEPSAAAGKHACKGLNDCKGQGGCSTGKNGCKGKNDCKGQGGCKTA